MLATILFFLEIASDQIAYLHNHERNGNAIHFAGADRS